MPSIFCEFVCYNRELCVNKPISFFSDNTGPNVNKKIHTNTKVNKKNIDPSSVVKFLNI